MSAQNFARRIAEIGAVWFTSDAACTIALGYRHHYLDRYLAVRDIGGDPVGVAHARSNARGRFYEHMVAQLLSFAARAEPSTPIDFVCAGGAMDPPGCLERDDKGDVVARSPSWQGGPDLVRAEFNALCGFLSCDPLIVEVTNSSKNVGDLIQDLWRKQLVWMAMCQAAAPPPILLVSPHPLPTVPMQVRPLRRVFLPFPEALWQRLPRRAMNRQLVTWRACPSVLFGRQRDRTFPCSSAGWATASPIA